MKVKLQEHYQKQKEQKPISTIGLLNADDKAENDTNNKERTTQFMQSEAIPKKMQTRTLAGQI
jgi:hypothetical protein